MSGAEGLLGLGIVISLKDEVSDVVGKIEQRLLGLRTVSKDTIDSFHSGAKRFLGGFGLMAVGAATLTKAFAGPIGAAITFQSAMADVNKVADFTAGEYKQMSEALIDMSKRIPMATSELANIMAEAAQAGIARADLEEFTETAAKMGVAFDISAQEAGNAMAGLRSIFGLGQRDVTLLGDTVNLLSNSMNATASNILDFLNRAGGVGRQVGMSGQDLAAFGAAFLDLKTPPEVAARAINSLIMKLSGAGSASKGAQEAFQKLGFSGRELEGIFKKDAKTAMLTFLEAVNKSSDPIGALRSIIGEGFADDIAKLAGGSEKLKKVLGMVGKEANYAGSMLEEYNVRAGTVENTLQLLTNVMNAVKLRLGNVQLPLFGRIASGLKYVIEQISNLPEAVFQAVAAMVTLAGSALMLGGVILMVGGAMKMQPAVMALWRLGIDKVRRSALAAGRTLAGAVLPVLALIALSYAFKHAWENNTAGIRDAATVIKAGFNMAASAGKDGIAKIDAATAKKLKELGLWDLAITLGKVFYRIRVFTEGFRDGFIDTMQGIKKSWDDFMRGAEPVITKGREFLKVLGLLDETASTDSKTWYEWGVSIGGAIAEFVPIIAVLGTAITLIKTCSFVAGILNMIIAANPIMAVVSLVALGIYAMIIYWDDLKDHVLAVWESIYGIVTAVIDKIKWALEAIGFLGKKSMDFNVLSEKTSIIQTMRPQKEDIADSKAAAITPAIAKSSFTSRLDSMLMTDGQHSQIATPSAHLSAQSASVQSAKAGLGIIAQGQQTPTIKNDLRVKMEPVKTDVILDGDKVGQFSIKYAEYQSVRSGAGTRQ